VIRGPLGLASLALGLLVLALAGGVAYATRLEQNDAFCASCHTQPEAMFYERSLRAYEEPVDLASAHRPDEVRCIDCHGGEGLVRRAQVLALAAKDALKFYSGRYQQPAMMAIILPGTACYKCHREAVDAPGFENHLHNLLYDPEAPSLPCVRCHLSHEPADELALFVVEDVALEACEFCHLGMGRGPIGLQK